MKNLSSIAKQNKKLSLAVIALLLAILIVSSATFSWIEGSKNGKVSDTASSVSAGDGLYFTDINGNMIKEIVFPKITLEDCTSKDGRNFFFPTTETKVETKADSTVPSESMVYRAGTDADKNTKYISQDFNIVSYSVSDLYIDTRQSYINCTDSNGKVNEKVLQSLRLSLDFHDGSNPIVICPDNVTGYTRKYKPVTAINSAGAATETDAEATALSDYSAAASRPVTSFGGDETKRVTINMWLEGTDASCVSKALSSDQITLNIHFSTASEYTRTITFVDQSPNGWVDDVAEGGGNIKMFVLNRNGKTTTDYSDWERFEMVKNEVDNITYTCKIPDDVTDVIFGRFDPDNPNLNYNYWGTTQNMSDGDLNKYYAIGNGKSVDNVNYGYWVKESCSNVVDVELTEMPLTNQIKITKNQDGWSDTWNNFHAYFFKTENGSDVQVGNDWPGYTPASSYTNEFSQTVYVFTIPDGATKVTFNNGNNSFKAEDKEIGQNEGFKFSGVYKDGVQLLDEWGTIREDTSSPGIFANKGSTYDYKPNIYFKSATYGSFLSDMTFTYAYTDENDSVVTVTDTGVFNPTVDFNKKTNYGFTMYQPDASKRVYHMKLPADATIMFNGNDKNSATITLSGSTYKIKFYSATNYVNY